MTEYTIRYLHWLGFRVKKHVKFPDNFQELTRKQIVYFFKLTLQGANKEELVHRFVRRFYASLPIARILRYREVAEKAKKIYTWRTNQEAFENNAYYLDMLTKKFAFFDGIRYFTIAPVRRVLWFFGPKDEMKNISIAEFAYLDKEMLSYYQGDTEAIGRIMAILFRPLAISRLFSRYDRRQYFDDDRIQRRARLMAKVPDAKKVAVLTWFQMIRKELPQNFPHLYQSKKKNQDPEKYSWGDVIIQMSGDIPGKEDEVSRVNAWNFMYRLDLMMKEAKENKLKK